LFRTSVLVPSVKVPGVGEVTSKEAALALAGVAARDAKLSRSRLWGALGPVLSELQAAMSEDPDASRGEPCMVRIIDCSERKVRCRRRESAST
jgi:hypothetical protein